MAYLDIHPLHGAFLANKLDRLADLIGEQGEDILSDAGLNIPSRAVSTILLIGEHGEISAADIAAALEQPHQLVTQRAELLIDLAIIKRRSDPQDGRRKILVLTENGQEQFIKLQARLAQAADAFAGVFQEIGCDLPELTMRAMQALNRSSILDRIKSSAPSTTFVKAER